MSTIELGASRALPLERTATAAQRVDSVDLLRGLVMVVMVLDHTRDFFHSGVWLFDPTDPTRTTPLVFFTRWITHFCAPVFVLLAGVGVALQRGRGASRGEVSRFLWTRGLWLIVLEVTVVRFGLTFNLDYSDLGALQVIWALGVSMIVLAALIHLPTWAVAGSGVAMVLFHNTLDGFGVPFGPNSPPPTALQQLWLVLHQPGPITLFGIPGFVLYPLIPWIGVMAAGYALGGVYGWEAERRRRFLVRLGLAMTVGFLALRALDVYGDPGPWSVQPRGAVYTALSFLNVNKYPPSLLFLLMTLGPALVALAAMERTGRGPLTNALVVFGRVPLFFYLLQWIVTHGLAVLAGYAAGQPVRWLFLNFPERFANPPVGTGFGMGVVYAAWVLGILLLYPLCLWFAGVKRRRTEWWLRYL
ncbi:MAG TPA: heparan-alpha-glucosaminide N-acetyltransferase domain-containing protein [Longimicrobium sp.]